jgi:5-methylcytosine-specific restriction endonuclease McrA
MTTVGELLGRSSKKKRASADAQAVLAAVREVLKSKRSARPAKKVSTGRAKRFYASRGWKVFRYRILKERGRTCECCRATAADGAVIVVDHIRPLRQFWHLRLDPTNLQVLCNDCNMGKSNRDVTDWREPREPPAESPPDGDRPRERGDKQNERATDW